MGYITQRDYLKTIQDANLLQIITSKRAIQLLAEQSAQAECISYLKPKYDTSKEFTDTTKWIQSQPYSAADRVYLDADAYSATATYIVGALALQAFNVYRCNTAITVGEAFDSAKWDLLGAQGDIFYALYPFPLFDFYASYNIGDKVFHNGANYTCLIPTSTTTHEQSIQYTQMSNLPANNIFPDNSALGSQYWKNDGAYIIPANTDILLPSVWVLGDNRDQQLVEKLVDITLYHLHSRISPTNIPILRVVRYMGNVEDRFNRGDGSIAYPVYSALGWLQACQRNSDVTPNLPKVQPKKGGRVRFGGKPRNINSY